MAREDPTIYMRIPAELKAKLDSAAEAGRKSLTAEVVARLEATFAMEETIQTPEQAKQAHDEFLARFDRLALQVDALHKWMQRQREEGGIEMLEVEDQHGTRPSTTDAKRLETERRAGAVVFHDESGRLVGQPAKPPAKKRGTR